MTPTNSTPNLTLHTATTIFQNFQSAVHNAFPSSEPYYGKDGVLAPDRDGFLSVLVPGFDMANNPSEVIETLKKALPSDARLYYTQQPDNQDALRFVFIH